MVKPPPRFTRLSAADRRLALIEAALACMAEGGPSGFTVDRVCARAGVSRGLVTHHFGGMSGLLAAVYTHLYAEVIPNAATLPPGPSRLTALIDVLFDPRFFNRAALNTWLTMWGSISNTPELMEEHRKHYATYIAMVIELIEEEARATQTPAALPSASLPAAILSPAEADSLARSFICLVDGLCLQHCIDPPSMPAEVARKAALDFIRLGIGPA